MNNETLNRLVKEQEKLEEKEIDERCILRARVEKILYLIERKVITKKPVIRKFLFWTIIQRCPECGNKLETKRIYIVPHNINYYSCCCGYEYAEKAYEISQL